MKTIKLLLPLVAAVPLLGQTYPGLPVTSTVGPLSCGIRLYSATQVQTYCFLNTPPASLVSVCNHLEGLPTPGSYVVVPFDDCLVVDKTVSLAYHISWSAYLAAGATTQYQLSFQQLPCPSPTGTNSTVLFNACQQVQQLTPSNTNIKVAAAQYNQGTIPSNLYQYLPATLGQRFWYVDVNTPSIGNYANYPGWASVYLEAASTYVAQAYPLIYDVAAAKGLNHENMLLHFNTDYQVGMGGSGNPMTWSNMDCFDVFEQSGGPNNQGLGSCSSAVHGVFIANGTTYNDVTPTIYSGCGSSCQIANGSYLYFGYAEPVDVANFTMTTPAAGGSIAYQYWNGTAWSALTLRSDGTSGLTKAGAIAFTPPVDWANTVVNGSHTKFWVRLTPSGTTTAPAIATLTGDNWASSATSCGGACNMRGWSPTCPSGMVTMANGTQYCQTPSATATARFRYQGRASGLWNHNAMFFNIADTQGGGLSVMSVLGTRYQIATAAGNGGVTGANAIFFDDFGGNPSPSNPAWNENLTDLPCSPKCTSGQYSSYVVAFAQGLKPQLKTQFPTIQAIVINSGNPAYSPYVDANFSENSGSAYQIGNIFYQFGNEWDNYAPASNPANTKIINALWDNQHFDLNCPTIPCGSGAHLWPADRTSMAVLGFFYIAQNQNTALLYNTLGWSYADTDEFYQFSGTTTTTTTAITANLTGAVTFTVADASAFSAVGGPIWTNDYVLRIGGNDVVRATRSGNSFTTKPASANGGPVILSYPLGTNIEYAQVQHWSDPNHPTAVASKIWYWPNWFPAMWVNLGQPDPNGWNGGARDVQYLINTAASSLTSCTGGIPNNCAEVWRRDYQNAVVIGRAMHDNTTESELDTPGPAINLVDPTHKLSGPYYRLNSDGTTGPAITSLTLKGAEAAILMKSPIAIVPPPTVQSGVLQ